MSPDGIIRTVAGQAKYEQFQLDLGDGGPATEAWLNSPEGIAVDAAGNLFIADFNNFLIRKVSPDGIIQTVAGNRANRFAGDGGPATEASLFAPAGVAVDAAGNLFIADSGITASVR